VTIDSRTWAAHLESLAVPVLPELLRSSEATPQSRLAFAISFRDEQQSRLPTDLPLIAHLLGTPLPSYQHSDLSREHGVSPSTRPDLTIWDSLARPGLHLPADLLDSEGPFAPALRETGIEAWTEVELSSLHALASIAIIQNDRHALNRCRSSVLWHLEHMQPDNGTNRPWAIHAFAIFAHQHPDAALHAQTLVHNACVQRGRPDKRSAFIMLHSAHALRHVNHAT
jgi:hypothetical protein